MIGGGGLSFIGGGQSISIDRPQSLELAAAVGALLPDLAKAIRAIERDGKTRLSRRLRKHEEAIKAVIVGEALK